MTSPSFKAILMQVRLVGLIVFFSVLLSACNTFTPTPQQPIDETTLAPRIYHDNIQIAGRISAQYQQKNEPQSLHISFTCTQTAQQTVIDLISPFGQTIATMTINEQGALLQQGDKTPRYAPTANQLMQELFGWPIPVEGLRDWLQGFNNQTHNAGNAFTPSNSKSPTNIEGWDVSYPNWVVENNQAHPKRIDLSRQTQQAGFVTIKIVIDDWTTL